MLVDTSIWVDHLRQRDATLTVLLERSEAECHPFIVGELACGALRRRTEILGLLRNLPQTPLVEHDEALAFVDAHRLAGVGIGWVDAHLLASAMLGGTRLWTRDRRLAGLARTLGIGGEP